MGAQGESCRRAQGLWAADPGSARCSFGVWPFEGRLFLQCQPRQPKTMGDVNQMSMACNNCLSACDTKIHV